MWLHLIASASVFIHMNLKTQEAISAGVWFFMFIIFRIIREEEGEEEVWLQAISLLTFTPLDPHV